MNNKIEFYHAKCYAGIPWSQTPRLAHGHCLLHSTQATQQDFHALALKPWKPSVKRPVKSDKKIINQFILYTARSS